MTGIEIKNPEEYTEFDADEPGQLGARRSCSSRPTSRKPSPARCCAWSATPSASTSRGQMGEEFFATDKEGNPTQWDPADIGRILGRYHFKTMNPGIDAQRAQVAPAVAFTADFETLGYEERNGVAYVTLNRPERHNAFNSLMQRELQGAVARAAPPRRRALHRAHRRGREGVLHRHRPHGADGRRDRRHRPTTTSSAPGATPFMFNDPGDNIGPKSCDLWKPVIAAVNGMACGGAFYMLGEVEFIIAAEHATFFDPHVTYGMTAAFEPIHMSGIMPFPEIMRLSLLGNYERMSAARAHEIGMVSEVAPAAELMDRATWAAEAIASAPPLAIAGHRARALGRARARPARRACGSATRTSRWARARTRSPRARRSSSPATRIEWRLR